MNEENEEFERELNYPSPSQVNGEATARELQMDKIKNIVGVIQEKQNNSYQNGLKEMYTQKVV